MTEQEKEIERVIKYIRSCRDAGIDTTITIDKNKSHFILNALEEIQQYRALGTVEDIKKIINFLSLNDETGLIDDATLLNQYRMLGTVEELKEARGKQIAKKVIPTPEHDYYTFKCPVCDKHYDWCLRSRYCHGCGQKIDWSEI